jgi:voltage-gated potassium channel
VSLKEDLLALGLSLPEEFALDEWMARLTDHPGRNTAAAVAIGALLFYAAEKQHNPKVNDVFDAAIYTSTCLSVGYGDIFAKTTLGKIIGTALMTIGPALSGAALDGPVKARHDETKQQQEQILNTLQQILAKLEKGKAGDESGDETG